MIIVVQEKPLQQPVDDVQLNQLRVEWVPHDAVKPNRYNPNRCRGNV